MQPKPFQLQSACPGLYSKSPCHQSPQPRYIIQDSALFVKGYLQGFVCKIFLRAWETRLAKLIAYILRPVVPLPFKR